jgi:phosphotransferase system enzyme I (PtsI)
MEQRVKPFSEEVVLQGVPVSRGIAIAPIYVVARGFSAPEVYPISDVETEQQRFRAALEKTKGQLRELQQRIAAISGEREGSIFEAHLMMLEDPAIVDRVNEAITKRRQNAEYALYAVTQNFLEAMRRVLDPYLRERTADIEDVCQRVLRNFRAEDHGDAPLHAEHLLVAYDLSPSDTASMNRRHLLGFATEMGSVNSHTAILARSLGIPAIVGVQGAVLELQTLTPAVLDGYGGKLILNPSADTLAHYHRLKEEKARLHSDLEAHRDDESITTDGCRITLSANIELAEEIDLVRHSGARGVGLYRTEFLLLQGEQMPGEAHQAEVYTQLARALAPDPLIIRTLDSGGDKLPVEPLTEPEPNPFLGWRGIRVSLDRPAMFKEQLRAILRASAHGKVAVMFPLVSGIREVRKGKELLRESMDELAAADVPFDENIDVGIMIELPSAAIIADLIAPEVDFFSIGTNDLIQYTVAADRVDHRVADLYSPTHPAVIRLIKKTIDSGREHGIWTGVCGEMAGDLLLTPLLLGLGVEELSVGPHQVAHVRSAIRHLNHAECTAMADEAVRMPLSFDVLEISSQMARKHYPDLLD